MTNITNSFITAIDIVKGSQILQTIWRQELDSTLDCDTLNLLVDCYLEAIPHNIEGDTTYQEFYNEIKFLYFSKELVLTN
jgi:hypothetical protein